MTPTQIQALKPGETLWDKDSRVSVKGLHLRSFASGEKVFYLYYRTRSGQQRKPKIGTLGELTLAEARSRAKQLLERVFAGEDPQAEWTEQKGEMTVAELYAKCLRDHWSQERYVASGWKKQVENFWKNNLEKPFSRLRLSEVKISRVREWHQAYAGDAPTTGNRALEVLSRLFRFAEEHEIREMNTNPCSYIKAHPERKRERYASPEELQKLNAILERESKDHPAAVAFVYLLALTGSRPSAIARATWEDLEEFETDEGRYGILTFDGKTTADSGSQEKVIVPPQAMKVLDRLERREGGTLTGLTAVPHRQWFKWRFEAGCPDLWIRDLRRTFATVGMSGGVGKDQIGRLLNHKSAQTTDLYAKLNHDAALVAATAVAGKVDSLLRGQAIGRGAPVKARRRGTAEAAG